VGISLKNWGRYQEAMPYLRQAEQLAERIQEIEVLSEALEMQIECWFRQDRWDEVIKIEGNLLDIQRRYGLARAGPICYSLGFIASVLALRGEPERARELREESHEIMTTVAGGSEETWWRSQHY
jgi:tetratricopeptide (TPR) repeat protein